MIIPMTVPCPNCRIQNPDGHRFCGQCGTALARACQSCGFENPPDSKFCGGCGNKLDGSAGQSRDYVTSRIAARGERKLITVLFADICKSTELVERLDPEQAAELLQPAIEAMSAAVRAYEGTVNKSQGDGIMALFGAPLAHEDHAVRAALAALAIQRGIADLGFEDLKVRVGLNSGEVVVRSVSNDLSMDYDAVGQTVNLAARMEQMATPGNVLLTAATRRLADDVIKVQSQGVAAVKGLTKPIEIFQLTGAERHQSSWMSRQARGLSKFVGRHNELVALAGCLDRLESGRGVVAAIVGEPGQGKSRLAHEFVHHAQQRSLLVLRTETLPHGSTTPYLPISGLLRSMFAVEAEDSQTRIAQRASNAIKSIDGSLADFIPALQSVLDVPVNDAGWGELDPQVRRRRIIDGVKALCVAQAKSGPFVLIIEDLHWIDTETQAVLDILVDALGGVPIMLVVTYRPEYVHEWAAKSYYTGIRLNPLGQAPAAELLNYLMGTSPELDQLKRLLIERTEGTPLFLEEIVRGLVETGILEGERGDYRVGRPVTDLHIPETVQSVLAARIDRLTPDLKDLLQTASVVGRTVPMKVLLPLGGYDEGALNKRLSELVAAEFLYETGLPPDIEHTFKHALTEMVAYEGLLKQRRRDLHGRLLQVMETVYADRLAEHLEELSLHARKASEWAKAYHYNLLAARKSHARSAYGQAIVFFEQASAALDALPDAEATTNDKIDVRLEMRTALWPLGDHDKLARRIGEARQLAEAAGETARLANVHSYLTAHYWQHGNHEQAIIHGLEGIRLAEIADDFSTGVTSRQHLGLAYLARGDYRASTDLHRKVAKALTGPPATKRHGMAGYPSALARGFLARGLAELGDFDDALQWAEEGLELAGHVSSVMTSVWVTDDLAMVHIRAGDADKATALMEENLKLCRDSDVWLLASLTAGVFGHALTLTGDIERAIPILEEAVAPSILRMSPEGAGFPFVWLGGGYLAAGRTDDARKAAEQALEISSHQGESGHQAWALRLMACIAANDADAANAGKWLAKARRMAEPLHMGPLIAQCDRDRQEL